MKTASDAVRTLGDRTPNENPSISPGPLTTISQEAPGGSRRSPDEIQRTRRLDRRTLWVREELWPADGTTLGFYFGSRQNSG